MNVGALTACIAYLSWYGLTVFLVSSAVTLCIGHSLGMHRRLIHRSYQCSKWFEYLSVFLGAAVGLGGPKTMIVTHDFRDWAQRQAQCHDFFAHRQAPLRDAWWQMHCQLKLEQPPTLVIEAAVAENRFYRLLDSHAAMPQLLLALPLYWLGGIEAVLWGVCARVTVSVFGHWAIGYLAHNRGHQHQIVEGAAVQGYNVRFASLITFGESWHNNHHAWPDSPKLGHYAGEWDPGWWLLLALNRLKVVRL